jgi:hypothetical protein
MIQSRAIKTFDPIERHYCCIATAIIGGAGLSAAGAIGGSLIGANAQTNAANASIANQNAMYAKNTAVLNPFIQAGQGQIANQQALLSGQSGPLSALNALTMPGANQNAALAQTPGYQFALQQGNIGVNNALAARGLGGSGGAVAKGVANYDEGLAGNTWQSVVGALQNSYNSQTGAGQNLINSGSQAGSALAGVGTSTANANSSALIGAGTAQAASANAIGSAVGGVGGSLGTAALLQQLTGGGAGAGGIYTGTGIGPTSMNGGLETAPGVGANYYGIG